MSDTGEQQVIDWQLFPIVPKSQQPRPLYHVSALSKADKTYLISNGWEPTDCRLLPDKELNDRSIAVLAWLSGVRMGSIIPEIGQSKFIEMEMRCCGLYIGRQQTEKKDDMKEDDLASILSFGKK